MTNTPESTAPKWHDAWHGPCCCTDGSHGLGDEGENMADAADLNALEDTALNLIVKAAFAKIADLEEALRLANEDAERLAWAFRLTREYVGEALLPAIEGWSWFDALKAHAERTGK